MTSEQQHGFNHWIDELAVNGACTVDALGSTITNSPPAADSEHESIGTTIAPGPMLNTGRFNQILELPRLIRWFSENSDPPKAKLNEYLNTLNSNPVRKHGEKVSVIALRFSCDPAYRSVCGN